MNFVLYGHTGSGKSTTSNLVREYFQSGGYRVQILKLAQPLYDLQSRFYETADVLMGPYDQDQVLLEEIASQLRRISPTSIVDDFLRRLEKLEADIVINDDLRDAHVDYPMLKQWGFRFVRITCSESVRLERLSRRQDVSTVIHSNTTAEIDLIEPDVVIDNSIDDLEKLKGKVHTAMESLRS